MKKRACLIGLAAVLATPAAPAVAAAPATLRIIPVDVEGGAATLYITPQGHSLLIDTGWPAGMGGPRAAPGAAPSPPTPSSAERIAAAAKAAGMVRIDYVLITHYHIDHVGGVRDLLGVMPVGTFIDHGPNREEPKPGATPGQIANAPASLYPLYVAATAGHRRRSLTPGETVRIDDLLLTALDSDRAVIAAPLRGSGKAGIGCDRATTNADLGGEENPRSLGIVASWGDARILSLGDTTWDVENQLVCPIDRIGPIDLMFADNHGTANSNSPPLIETVRPTVLVLGNGPAKGADAATFATARAARSIKGVWQLHFATRSPADNAPADQIANPAGPDARFPLQIAVTKDGIVTMTNPRNGFTQTYPRAVR